MTTTTQTARLTAADEIAARLTWRGASGEFVTGADAAHHLEAALALLERDGWSRTLAFTTDADNEDKPESAPVNHLKGADESWPVKKLLLALARTVSDHLDWEWTPAKPTPRTLSGAMHEVRRTEDGDHDSWYVATSCVEAVLRLRTGAPTANLSAWSEKHGRTYADVRELLTEAAAFARKYGPAA